MSKNRSKRIRSVSQRGKGMLPYDTIRAAVKGDPDAMNAVLRHYEGYIASLSLRRLHDDHGNVYLCVDEAMRRRLEIKLLTGILAFRAA